MICERLMKFRLTLLRPAISIYGSLFYKKSLSHAVFPPSEDDTLFERRKAVNASSVSSALSSLHHEKVPPPISCNIRHCLDASHSLSKKTYQCYKIPPLPSTMILLRGAHSHQRVAYIYAFTFHSSLRACRSSICSRKENRYRATYRSRAA